MPPGEAPKMIAQPHVRHDMQFPIVKNSSVASCEVENLILYVYTLPHFTSVDIVQMSDFFWYFSRYTLAKSEQR